MAGSFAFELVSPRKLLFSGEADMVVIPGEEGDLGVLAEHAPLIATVRPGVVRVYQNGAVSQRLFVSGGFVEVTQTRCTMLADEALPVAQIDRAAAERDLQALQQPNAQQTAPDPIEERARKRKLAIARAKLLATAA